MVLRFAHLGALISCTTFLHEGRVTRTLSPTHCVGARDRATTTNTNPSTLCGPVVSSTGVHGCVHVSYREPFGETNHKQRTTATTKHRFTKVMSVSLGVMNLILAVIVDSATEARRVRAPIMINCHCYAYHQ